MLQLPLPFLTFLWSACLLVSILRVVSLALDLDLSARAVCVLRGHYLHTRKVVHLLHNSVSLADSLADSSVPLLLSFARREKEREREGEKDCCELL